MERKQPLAWFLALLVAVILIEIPSTTLSSSTGRNNTIRILCLLPYPQANPDYHPSFAEGPAISLSLNMARDQINEHKDILTGHTVELIHADSGCDFTDRAFVSFISNVYASLGHDSVHGIIGPGCSSSALALGPVSSHDGVSILTVHGGGSPLLGSRTKFPYSLGTLGSTEGFIDVALQLMNISSWKTIAILFDESRVFYSSTKELFVDRIKEVSGEVKFFSPVYNSFIPLSVIRDEMIRIIFILTPAGSTREILCLAYHLQLIYPLYQYIVSTNTYSDLATAVYFTYSNNQYYCSENEMVTIALNGVTFINYRLSPFNETDITTYANISFQEYDDLFRKEIEKYNLDPTTPYTNVSYTVWSTYFYDALWAWALVWDRLIQKPAAVKLAEYEYGNITLSNVILNEFYNLDFEGVSGRVVFQNSTGFLNRDYEVFQVVNGTLETVAYYSQGTLDKIGPLQYIPDAFDIEVNFVPPAVVTIFLIVEVAQGIVVIVLHVLTIKYHNYPSVKAASFKLNQLIFVGSYLFLISMLMGTLDFFNLVRDTISVVICNIIWPWLFPLSFTLTFGTVAVRTWRLYRIFTHYLNPGRLISNPILIGIVLLLTAVDAVLGTLWVSIDPLQLREDVIEVNMDGNSSNIINKMCLSGNYYLWFFTVIAYRVILLTAVLILVVLTRKIKNQSFTTKTLRVLVYLFSAVFIGGFIIFYLFLFYMPLSSLDFVVLFLTLNTMLFLFITLVFLPPLFPLLREKLKDRYPVLKKESVRVLIADDYGVGNSTFYI